MSFTVLGIKINISVPFAVVISFLLVSDKTGLMSASLFAVFFHEIGHLTAMKLLNCIPKEIKLGFGGILIVGNSYCTIKENIIIAVSGPFSNLLFTLVFWLIGYNFDLYIFKAHAIVGFIVGVVNVLPIESLDGGTVLRFCLLKFNIIRHSMICTVVSIITACVITVLGIVVFQKNVSNPSLLLLGIYLIIINSYRLGQ